MLLLPTKTGLFSNDAQSQENSQLPKSTYWLLWKDKDTYSLSQYIIKLDSGYVPLLFTNFVFSVIVIPILAPLDLKS